jgi:MFS transporter, FSR family, fosmidomycin resistance protein
MRPTNNVAPPIRQAVSRWRVLGIACLAHALHDGYSSTIYLLLPVWQAELGLNLAEIGILKTLYSGGMAVGQVPAARLGGRWGERLLLFAGTLLSAAAVFAFHRATSAFVLGLLLVAGGLGASVQHPLASTLILKTYAGSALRTTLGTYNFAGDLGKVAIPGLLTVLIAGLGWRTGTETLGVLGVAIAVILLVTLLSRGASFAPENRPAATYRPALHHSIRRRGFAVLSAVGMLDSATRTGFLTFLPFVLAGKGADTAVIGAALSLIFAGGAVGKFACGALATRIGILRTVAVTEIGTALAITLLLVLPLSVCFVLMPALGVALNGTSSVLYGTVPDLAPKGREARAFGLFYTVTIGADAVAPTVYGMAGHSIGLSESIMLVVMINLVILPLLVVLRPALKPNERMSRCQLH